MEVMGEFTELRVSSVKTLMTLNPEVICLKPHCLGRELLVGKVRFHYETVWTPH